MESWKAGRLLVPELRIGPSAVAAMTGRRRRFGMTAGGAGGFYGLLSDSKRYDCVLCMTSKLSQIACSICE